MSNAPKTTAPADVKWFPVRCVTFALPTSIPGAPARVDLRGDQLQENQPRWTIEFSPSWRHHRITYFSVDKTKEPEVRMVPEANVKTWEPMP